MSAVTKKHRRGPWSQAEDAYLMQLVQQHGAHNWVRISELIQFRSPKQCRERYHQNLKPSLNLSPITPEEGQLIERMVAEMGKRWAEIARRLHGRSDNAVKNWWNGGMNRRKRLEARRREAQNRASMPMPRPAVPEQPSAQQMALNQQFAEYAQRPALPMMEQFPHIARMQPPPHPVFTGQVQVPSQRHLFENQLPSPSAVSHGSQESDEHPPSLVSDTRTISNHHSPTANHPAVELPPLAPAVDDKMSYQQQAQQYSYQPNVQTWPSNASEMYHSRDMALLGNTMEHQYYYNTAGMDRMLPSQGASYPAGSTYPQYQLPSFNAVATPDIRHAGVPSPPRDNRMALSKITN